MAVTFNNMAKISTQTSMAVGQAQAQTMGLGKTEGNALAITNMMGKKEDGQGMMGIMDAMGSKERLRGEGFKQDLMNIAGAALAVNKTV